jgi:hypothetical protein
LYGALKSANMPDDKLAATRTVARHVTPRWRHEEKKGGNIMQVESRLERAAMEALEQIVRMSGAKIAEQLVVAEAQTDPELKALVQQVVRRAFERTLKRLHDEGCSS